MLKEVNQMPIGIDVTEKIHAKIVEKAQEFDVKVEGLASVLLVLGLSNETILKQALDFMRIYDLGGSVDMEKKGW